MQLWTVLIRLTLILSARGLTAAVLTACLISRRTVTVNQTLHTLFDLGVTMVVGRAIKGGLATYLLGLSIITRPIFFYKFKASNSPDQNFRTTQDLLIVGF